MGKGGEIDCEHEGDSGYWRGGRGRDWEGGIVRVRERGRGREE